MGLAFAPAICRIRTQTLSRPKESHVIRHRLYCKIVKQMHTRTREQAGGPFRAALGELIYELVGNKPSLGGAVKHSLAQVIVPYGTMSPRHYHRVLEETYFLLKGKARMIIDGHEFALTPGEACLIMPGEVHQVFNDSEETLEFLVFCAPPWTADDFIEV